MGRSWAEISVLLRGSLRRIEALDSRISSCSGAAKAPRGLACNGYHSLRWKTNSLYSARPP